MNVQKESRRLYGLDSPRSLRTITILHARTAELAINDDPALSQARLTKSSSTVNRSSYIPSSSGAAFFQATILLDRDGMHGPAGTSDNDDRYVCLL